MHLRQRSVPYFNFYFKYSTVAKAQVDSMKDKYLDSASPFCYILTLVIKTNVAVGFGKNKIS